MYVGYEAPNCTYVINTFEGVSVTPKKDIQNPIRKISEDEYETVFHIDAVQDEDYFGQGICRWQPINFGTAFKATGLPEETEFNVSDVMRKLLEKKTITKYYWKRDYPYSRKKDGSVYTNSTDFGIISPELYSAEEHKNFFSITVTLEEVK